MTDPVFPARPAAIAIRYLAIIAGCACLLLTAVCFAIACQVFIQTGVFAQSYAMVGLISGALGLLALKRARVRRSALSRSLGAREAGKEAGL